MNPDMPRTWKLTRVPTPGRKVKRPPFRKQVIDLDAEPHRQNQIPVAKGVRFKHDGELFEITRVRANGKLTVRNLTSNSKATVRVADQENLTL